MTKVKFKDGPPPAGVFNAKITNVKKLDDGEVEVEVAIISKKNKAGHTIDLIKKQRQEASKKSRGGDKFYINDVGDGNYEVSPKEGRICITAYKNGSEVCV